MCTQTKPAHIPYNMLREVMIQVARWHQGGTPIPHTSVWINLEDLGGDRQTKNDETPAYCRFPAGSSCWHDASNCNAPPLFPHPWPQFSSEIWVTNRVPLQESLCICVTGSQSLKGAQNVQSPRSRYFSPRHQLAFQLRSRF